MFDRRYALEFQDGETVALIPREILIRPRYLHSVLIRPTIIVAPDLTALDRHLIDHLNGFTDQQPRSVSEMPKLIS